MEEEQNPYSPPAAAAAPVAPAEAEERDFFPVSISKLVVMEIATFGIYFLYWFYSNWKRQQSKMEKAISPFWRAVFFIFFTHELFNRMEAARKRLSIQFAWQPAALATLFVVLSIVDRVLDRLSRQTEEFTPLDLAGFAILFINLFPLIKAQQVVNLINGDSAGELNATYSGWNILFIVLGVAVWGLVMVGVADSFFGIL